MKKFLAFAACLFWATTVSAEVDIKDVKTPGGLNAWLVEDHAIPFTALEISFKGGTSLDDPAKRGAVYLMAGLLEEGAGDPDARAFARRLEELAASFSFDASDDHLTISARFLTENRDEVLALLRTVLTEPRYDQEAIDRVRAQVLSGLRSDENDPNDIAGHRFNAMLYGDHPYGTPEKGTIDSVTALTRDDIVAAHDAVIARANLHVGAAGDVTAADLATIIDTLFADLPETGAPMPTDVVPAFDGGVTVVPFQTPQSVAIFGQPGLDREDEDFFAAFIMNTMLGGGGFESRLMSEVREARGLTYGIYSYLVPKDYAVSYLGSFSTSNARMAEAIEVVKDEWAKAATDGFTDAEVEAAKLNLTGAYPLRFSGNSQIASILVAMQEDDLPIDYVATRNDKLSAVTTEDINRFAAEFLDPDMLQFVVVGDPAGLEETASN